MPTLATLPGINPRIPAKLQPLLDIAYNFQWSFNAAALDVFERLDPIMWEETGHNPVKLLATISPERLEALALDDKLVAKVKLAHESLLAHMADKGWFEQAGKSLSTRLRPFQVAYFCAEFGLHECFQIYSGGLGLLAGDHLKSASDLGLPLIGVGLLYRNGYFHQALDATGYQQELFPALDAPRHAVHRVMDLESGRQLTVGLNLPGREVRVAVWRADVGKVRLYLLDTNIHENSAEDREITANLYLGDQRRRIEQELVLGIAGVRALDSVGERPTVFHLNEGHAAFLAVERIRQIRERTGLSFDQAREAAACSHVFTTHTPVPAGIDHFNVGLVQHYFGTYHDTLGLDMEGFMALGRENVADTTEAFSMAILAIRCSRFCNGVSKLHGDVSRKMWNKIWPDTPEADVPIGHVTNGVHTPTWVSPIMAELFDKHLGRAWRDRPQDPASWAGIDKASDAELWGAREQSRGLFIEYCKRASGYARTGGTTGALDKGLLTIGFARRFAGYKRGTLLFRDPQRLKKILAGSGGVGGARGVQFVLSGKSHPGDGWGKDLIKDIVAFARSSDAMGRVLFIEDYAIDVAREMIRGCDVWLNTPIRGLEASGTSGMKAAINGVLHASILDGWWDEAFTPEVGYKIDDTGVYLNDAPNTERDDREADALYRLIESQLVPEFYTRDAKAGNAPKAWTAKMRGCIKTLAPFFSTGRMVAEYATSSYFPAHAATTRLNVTDTDISPARELADHIAHYRKNWAGVRVKSVQVAPAPGGNALAVAASVRLGLLRPDECRVEAYHGVLDRAGHLGQGKAITMTAKAPLPGGDGTYHYIANFAPTPHDHAPYGVLIRVLPGDDRLVTPFVPGLIVNSAPVLAEPDPGAHL